MVFIHGEAGQAHESTVTRLFPGLSTQNTLSNRLQYVLFYTLIHPLCDMHE